MEIIDLDKSIMPWLGKTGKLMGNYIADRFKQHNFNLTIEQWIVLKILHEQDGMIQNDLAHITNRNKTTLTRLIHTMEKYNLIARLQDDDDKRVNKIFLTKKGRKTFQTTLPVIKDCIRSLQLDLSENEINSLIKILKKVQKNLKVT